MSDEGNPEKNQLNLLISNDNNNENIFLNYNNDIYPPDFVFNENQCFCESFSFNNNLKEIGKFYESNPDYEPKSNSKLDINEYGMSLFN